MKKIIKQAVLQLKGSAIKRILGPHVHSIVIKSENGLLAVDPEDLGVGSALRKDGKYGINEIERIKTHINPQSRILIVGAHIGTLAIPLSKIAKEVIAIEANPDTYDLLTMNIALNTATNCSPINIAASSRDEEIQFLLNTTNSGGSKRVPKIKDSAYYYDNPKQISVKAVALDNFLKEKNFDIVLMDIEGSEYFALQGMREILSNCKQLIVEFLPHHLKNVSGITVPEFLSVISPYFSKMTIPSKQLEVAATDFTTCLTQMYELGQGDDGIIFEKT